MIRSASILLSPVLVAMFAASPGQAQDDDPYAACAATQDDAARLACFDATFIEQRGVRAEAEQRRIEEERTAEQRCIEEERLARQRAAEEARLEEERRIAEYGMPDSEEQDMVINAEVQDLFTDSTGRALVTLSNGQIWREVGGSSMRNPLSSGMASVESHWSGAFTMRFEGRRGFLRVRRYR